MKHRKITNSAIDICILTGCAIPPEIFEKCINAVVREAPENSQVYVFRNGNVPETRQEYDRIVATIPGVREKHSVEDLGYPMGANRIMKSGTSPLILFVSDDVILHEGAVSKLMERMKDEDIAICGLKLLFPEDSPDKGRPAGRVQHIGHGIDIRGEVTHPLLGWKPENPKCNVSRDVISVTGAAFIVRRSAFLKAGGFYEGYGRGYFEDVDLCLTFKSMGLRVFIDTEAVATHYVGATFAVKKTTVPIDQNRMILRQRKGHLLEHTSWSFW